MASIVPKPNGTYLIRISCGCDATGRGITRSRIFKPSRENLSYQKLNREMDAFIKAFEEEAATYGTDENPDKITFATFCEKFLEIKSTSLSPKTIPFYEKVIREQLIPMYGKMKLRDIRTFHIQQYIQFLCAEKPREDGKSGHIAPPTVKRYTTVFRSIMSLAYKMEYISSDIGMSRRLEFPKMQTAEVEVFTFEEVSDILHALEDEPIRIKALIEVALFTGMRRGEIVGLKWSDIDFERKRLSVKRSIYKPKSEKALEKEPKSKAGIRTMTIPDRLITTLLQYKQQQNKHIAFLGDLWENRDYIFTEENGYVMNPYTPTKQFDHFLKRYNIRHLKFHGLRHTSATMLLAGGCDVKTVSVRLGHSDLETTNIYLHALESTDRIAADTFDRFAQGVSRR